MTDDFGRAGSSDPSGPGIAAAGLVGGVIGLLTGFALAWSIGGNPFGDVNQVQFVELTVATVGEDADRLCWAEDPERRDSTLQCAVLALDASVTPPAEGDDVTVGLLRLSAPDGTEVRQIVHVGPVGPREAASEAAALTPAGAAATTR